MNKNKSTFICLIFHLLICMHHLNFSSATSLYPSVTDDQLYMIIRASLDEVVSYTIPAGTSTTISVLAQLYYGDPSFSVLIRSANPQLRPTSGWSGGLTGGSKVVLPSVLTCVDFLPSACLAFSYQSLLAQSTAAGLSVLEDAFGSEVAYYEKNYALLTYNSSITAFTCFSHIANMANWILNQSTNSTFVNNFMSSALFAYGIRYYYIGLARPLTVQVNITNNMGQNLLNGAVYHSPGRGKGPLPYDIIDTNKGLIYARQSAEVGGVYGYVTYQIVAQAATVPYSNYFTVAWELRTEKIYRNKVAVSFANPNAGQQGPTDKETFLASMFDQTGMYIDETQSGSTIILSSNVAAQVFVSNDNQCQVTVILTTISSRSAGIFRDTNYTLSVYPQNAYPIQVLESISTPFMSEIEQAPLFGYTNQVWKFIPINSNYYQIQELASMTAMQVADDFATSLYQVNSGVLDTNGNNLKQLWYITPQPNLGGGIYYTIQSVYNDLCLQASYDKKSPDVVANPGVTTKLALHLQACTPSPSNSNYLYQVFAIQSMTIFQIISSYSKYSLYLFPYNYLPLVVTTYNFGVNQGPNVYPNFAGQIFNFTSFFFNSKPYYAIQNQQNFAITLNSTNGLQMATLTANATTPNWNQLWTVTPQNNYYHQISLGSTTSCLTCTPGNSTQNLACSLLGCSANLYNNQIFLLQSH